MNPKATSQRLAYGILLDDNADHAQLLLSMIEKQRPALILDWVHTMPQALQAIQQRAPDILIADMFLGGKPLGASLDGLRSAAPAAHLVILSGADDSTLAAAAMKQGANEYLLKNRTTLQKLPKQIDRWVKRLERAGRKKPQQPADDLSRQLHRGVELLVNQLEPLERGKRQKAQHELRELLTQIEDLRRRLET